jgi:peptide/nickel transport system substrate-binding protein
LDQTRQGKAFVGTGPFRFKEWVPGDHFTVTRNADYWHSGRPYLDEVEIKIGADPSASVISLETGAVDWLTGIPLPDARRLQKDSAYQLLKTGGGGYWYLGLDLSVPALGDQRVRQAFGYALDRQRMVDTALLGFGRAGSIAWPQQALAYDKAQDETYTYDPARARQLLHAAGWDPTTAIKLTISSAIPAEQAMASILQEDLAKIGMRVDLQRLEPSIISARLQKGEFGGAWIHSFGFMNFQPATFYSSAIPVRLPNSSHYESTRYKQLIGQTLTETDDQKLKQALHELTQITLDEAFVLPISENVAIDAARGSVKNILWDGGGHYQFEGVALEA